jgi:two-component system phosphate regulon sensor histidine kinase PhoR
MVRGIDDGDLEIQVPEQSGDALGRLGGTINRMVSNTRQRFDAVEREREERGLILAHISDAVALVDGADRIIHANPGLSRIVGDSTHLIPETPLDEVLHSQELADIVHAARHGDEKSDVQVRLTTPDSKVLRVSATRFESAGKGSVLLVLKDMTEFERQNQIRQDFVANVSHELRTPLTSLRGYAETLLEGALEDEQNRERFVRTIYDQSKRLEELVVDLLSLTQLERSGPEADPQLFDMREVAEKQVAALQRQAARAGLSLDIIPGPKTLVLGDRSRIDQVLANLLDNAIKYTEQGGIHVSLGTSAERAWCEVSDTGVGIPDADKSRIFERFYRVDKARSREKGGTGLGLAIVKHVLALHGGEISVRSTVGKGSAFKFFLPIGQNL